MVKHECIVFIILACFLDISAQEDFLETDYRINDLFFNSTNNEIIYANDSGLYFLDYETLKIKDSVKLIYNNSKYISSFKYLNTPQPLIIIKTKRKQIRYTNFFEFPSDSIYFYNRTQGEIANKLAGNFYVSFHEKNPTIAAIGANKYNDYTDRNGYVNKSPFAGELQSLPNQKTIPSNGIIRNMQLSNDGKKVAIIYYKYFGKEATVDHILEVRSLPELELLNSRKIKDRTTSILFSENDDVLVLKKDANITISDFSLSHKGYIKIYDSSNLEELTEIPKDLTIKGVIENSTVWKRIGGDIINEDYNTKQKMQEIWSNLTPFSSIDGFVKIDNEQVLLYGNKGSGFNGEKNGIFKFQLKNEAIFSKVKVVSEIDSLYNPFDAKILDNKVAVSAVQYRPKNHLLLIENEAKYNLSGFQLWSSLDKMKLYNLEFDGKVNPFLDNKGETCLIFEEHQGKHFGDFKLKVLNVKTGISKVRLFVDSDFNGLDAKCYNLKSQNDQWICSDGFSKFWSINANSLSVNLLFDLSNAQYYRTDVETFRGIPNSDKVLIALNSVNVAPNHSVTESHFEGYKILDASSGIIQDLAISQTATDVFPLDDTRFVFNDNDHLRLYNKESGVSNSISKLTTSSKIRNALLLDDEVDIIIDRTDRYADSLNIINYNIKNATVENRYKIPSAHGIYKTHEGLNYYKYDDAYYTYNFNLNAKVRWNNHKPKFTQSHDLNLNNKGKLLYRGEWLIDLKTLEIEDQLKGFTKNVLLDDNQIVLLDAVGDDFGSDKYKFRIVSATNADSIVWESKTLKMDFNERPDTRVWSKDKKTILFYNSLQFEDKQTIYLVDVKSKTVVSKKINHKIKKAKFAETSQQVALQLPSSFQKEDKTMMYSISDLKFIKALNTHYDDELDKNNYIYTDYEYVIHNKITGDLVEEQKNYYARQSLKTSKYLKSENLIVAGTENGSLVFWDMDNSSPKHIEKVSDSEIIRITQMNNMLYVLSKDSSISVVNLDTLRLDVSCKVFENGDDISLAWVSPNGFFKASKSDIRNFHFVRQGKALPLVDYEVFLNRPDYIMQKLGFASPKLYGLYKDAYLKRLARHDYNENTDIFNLNRPLLKLTNRAKIPILTKAKELTLNLENTSNASGLIVYINGVPVSQKVIKGQSKLNTTIALNSGLNRVSILSKSNKDIESDPISFEITSTLKRAKSKVYYIGIGVSKYQDSSMNLKYADKDVEKISSVLATKYKDRSAITMLLNEDVNKASVKELKLILENTDIDDTVIISFSGHGIIGKENDFYFAAHDIDFNSPEENGISYAEIQQLLTDIPARRKLLLIDACHSGELDATGNDKNSETKVVSIIPEGVKGSKATSTTSKNDDTFKLMQSLFFDINRGNGAYVISAAGGSEFAYEDDEWENGVFTYSFINALYDLGYDTWSGVEGIPISKMKTYIYERVKELTNNKQKPTSRAENLEWDWVLE